VEKAIFEEGERPVLISFEMARFNGILLSIGLGNSTQFAKHQCNSANRLIQAIKV